jgi:hypothetical protein
MRAITNIAVRLERAKGIEPSYAAWEGFDAPTISIRYRFFGSLSAPPFSAFAWKTVEHHDALIGGRGISGQLVRLLVLAGATVRRIKNGSVEPYSLFVGK